MSGIVEITMEFDKETPNTVRYREVNDTPGTPSRVGNLYIPKTTLAKLGNPNAIFVMIKALED